MFRVAQDALGSIACTGSNFLIRAAHLAEVGYFPTYTMVGFVSFTACSCPILMNVIPLHR